MGFDFGGEVVVVFFFFFGGDLGFLVEWLFSGLDLEWGFDLGVFLEDLAGRGIFLVLVIF